MSAQIFQQISKIMSEIDAIGKNNKNDSQGYKFRGIDDVYNELHPLMAKHSVFTATEVLSHERSERSTKSGGVMTYSVMKIKFTFYASDGSSFESITIGEGSDTGDKSSNKAMAVAHKYVLVQTFAIPTKDDKDPENQSPEFEPKRERAIPASQQAFTGRPPQKAEEKPESLGDYVAKFGQFGPRGGKPGIKLSLIPRSELESYLKYLENGSLKKNEPLSGMFLDFYEAGKAYIKEQDQDNIPH